MISCSYLYAAHYVDIVLFRMDVYFVLAVMILTP